MRWDGGARGLGLQCWAPAADHKQLFILKSMSKCSQINHTEVLSSRSIGQHRYRAFPLSQNVLARASLEHTVPAGLVGEHQCFAALVNRRVPWMLGPRTASWRERLPAPPGPNASWLFLGSQSEAGLRMDLPASINPSQGGGGRGVEVGLVWAPLHCLCGSGGAVLPPGTVPRAGPVCLGERPEGLERFDRHVLYCIPSPQMPLLKS